MPRTKIIVDKTELAGIIGDLELSNQFSTRTELAEAVALKLSVDVSPAVVLLRIKEFGLEDGLKTPKGKRGRQKGMKLSDSHKAAMQRGRKAKVVANVKDLKEHFPKSRHGLIDKIGSGSLAAAIKAKCIECCGNDTKEVKNCDIKGCPLWSFRPYQIKK